MCGLYGWTTRNPVTIPRAVWRPLAARAAQRGVDSWGTVHVRPHAREWLRGLGDVTRAERPARPTAPGVAHLGHTRAATSGSVSIANAHPFAGRHTTVAHNGFVGSHDLACGPVDSQTLAALIDLAVGEDPDQWEALPGLCAMGTVAWVDHSDPGAVYLLRLDAWGDLEVARGDVARSAGVIWASVIPTPLWPELDALHTPAPGEIVRICGADVDTVRAVSTGHRAGDAWEMMDLASWDPEATCDPWRLFDDDDDARIVERVLARRAGDAT